MIGREVGRPILSVSETTNAVRDLLAADLSFRDMRVRGEITAPKKYGATVYFSLKDAGAGAAASTAPSLNCVLWGRAGVEVPPVIDGAQVILAGSLGVYPARGQLQFTVRSISADGDGADALALEQLRLRLQAEGLFDEARKRALPRFPFHVTVISSLAAAGYGDFVRVLQRRAPHIRLTLLESGVQGDAAVKSLLSAIARIAATRCDVAVIVRGGGARDDLRIFNDERVVRALAAVPLPVITGIGHESDSTLIDFVADIRASTPTDAATRLAATEDLLRVVTGYTDRLERGIDRRFLDLRMHLGILRHRLERSSPKANVQSRRTQLATLRVRLAEVMARRLQRRAELVRQLQGRLAPAVQVALRRLRARRDVAAANLRGRDPSHVLGLGYAIVRKNGLVVSDVRDLTPGQELAATFAHGTANVRVESIAGDGR